jgi:hypothetical protein
MKFAIAKLQIVMVGCLKCNEKREQNQKKLLKFPLIFTEKVVELGSDEYFLIHLLEF